MPGKFRMLIGDDLFESRAEIMDTIFLVLKGISFETGLKFKEGMLSSTLGGRLHTYQCSNFPIPKFKTAEIHCVSTADKFIKQSTKAYDWLVTDLNYGVGKELEGLRVARELQNLPGIKAIFTSTGLRGMEEYIKTLNIAYIAAPYIEEAMKELTKAETLGRIIGRHYKKQ